MTMKWNCLCSKAMAFATAATVTCATYRRLVQVVG